MNEFFTSMSRVPRRLCAGMNGQIYSSAEAETFASKEPWFHPRDVNVKTPLGWSSLLLNFS